MIVDIFVRISDVVRMLMEIKDMASQNLVPISDMARWLLWMYEANYFCAARMSVDGVGVEEAYYHELVREFLH